MESQAFAENTMKKGRVFGGYGGRMGTRGGMPTTVVHPLLTVPFARMIQNPVAGELIGRVCFYRAREIGWVREGWDGPGLLKEGSVERG